MGGKENNMEHINSFKAAVAAVVAALTALWGWFGWLIIVWLFCMALDYITGSIAAMKAGEWSSEKARNGLAHKGGCIAVVLIAAVLDLGIGVIVANIPGITMPISYSVLVCPLVLVWYILTEAGSIIENAGKMGAEIPPWLRKAVSALKSGVDKTGDKLGGDEGKE